MNLKPAPVLLLAVLAQIDIVAVLAQIGTGATLPQYQTPSNCVYAGKSMQD
jgi:hypothetical protein